MKKTVSGTQIMYEVRHQSDGVMYRLLLSKFITGPSFNFIPYVEVKIPGRCAHPSSKPFMYKEVNVKRQKYKTIF